MSGQFHHNILDQFPVKGVIRVLAENRAGPVAIPVSRAALVVKVAVLHIAPARDEPERIATHAVLVDNGRRPKLARHRTFQPDLPHGACGGVPQGERGVARKGSRGIETAVRVEAEAVPAGVAEVEFNARLAVHAQLKGLIIVESDPQRVGAPFDFAAQFQQLIMRREKIPELIERPSPSVEPHEMDRFGPVVFRELGEVNHVPEVRPGDGRGEGNIEAERAGRF